MRPLLILFVVLVFNLHAQVYRWDVKIGVDTAGQRIYNLKAETETVQNLSSPSKNPKPGSSEINKGKRAEPEKRKVTITGYVSDTGTEEDGDYHLVIKALTGNKSLIAEIPDPSTEKLKKFPGYKAAYTKARKKVDDELGEPPSSVTPLDQKRKVKITGYVYFDKHAHGNGHADNDVEVHPVLKIEFLD